jgi:microcin C transport system permease protein
MTMKIPGTAIFLLGLLAAAGEIAGIAFPTARWFFETSHQVPLLHVGSSGGASFPWFGWLSVAVMLCGGSAVVLRSLRGGPVNPVTARRIRRFKQIRRGYGSLLILIVLGGLAALDRTVVGKRALAVHHGGKWTFPAFLPYDLKNKDFGVKGEAPDAPVDYRKLKDDLTKAAKGRVIMPLVPYDPTGDTLPPQSSPLVERDGIYHLPSGGKPFDGLAARYYDVDAARVHIRQTMRKGLPSGPAEGWTETGEPVYSATWQAGRLSSEQYRGSGERQAFLEQKSSGLRAIHYHPAPPIWENGHWLGTTSQGYDVVAYLYGGLQVNFKAALIYLPTIYLIGMTLGLMMGYFGGWFDLVMQRVIEVFSNIPFLFVIIIFASMVPEKFKGLPVILTILVLFGWMGMTFLMRTAAYRDKERDYIAAARVLGAGTPRILFRHLLPNTVAIVVTLVPFSMSGLIFALTSLDYLGFGLPPEYATWGRLLNDGLSNLSSPWLVTSTFVVLVGLLVLITFIGEAVREAFDPKKFTYFR